MEAPKANVLVVDDDPLMLKMIDTFLTGRGYLCHKASTVREALKTAELGHIDVGVIDVFLGNESGIDVVKQFSEMSPPIPCIVITGMEDEKVAHFALDAGAYGYLTKPFSLLALLVNIEGVLRRKRLEDLRDRYQEQLENTVRDRTRSLQLAIDAQQNLIHGVIKAMSEVVEVRDPYTAGHQLRTASLASAISQMMGLPRETTEKIYLAALLHDIGKIYVPSEILTKPGKLDRAEFELIKRHPVIGYRIIKNIPFSFNIHDIVLQHHERLDGSGYPGGLRDDEIMIEAKIIAVADVVEAMMSHRPYRPALGLDSTLKEIENHKGKLYDPGAVECCVELFNSRGFVFEERKLFPWLLSDNGKSSIKCPTDG